MRPSPEDLRDALASLPRARASSDFAARVLERLESRESRRRHRARWSVAALLLVAVATGTLWEVTERRREMRRQARVEALREESATLARELAELRKLTAQGEASLVLTGDEDYEIVMGLSPWIEGETRPALAADRNR
ncbi:MAG: hypothetical protein R2991_06185 [Thermoanaerobaculia bacterium]